MITPSTLRRLRDSRWFRTSGVALVAAVVVPLVLTAPGSPYARTIFQHTFVHAIIMAALAGWTLPRVLHRLHDVSVVVRWTVVMSVLLGLAVAGTSLACGALLFVDTAPRRGIWECFTTDFRINAVVTATICVGMILYATQRARLDAVTLELRTSELEHERASNMALELRLSTLEARLHPHFLFNTLNVISALIPEDPERAERTVERLAALLRFSLDATQRGLIPLAHELTIVGDYLEIEQARLGERLSFTLSVEPAVQACAIPPLAVQTLVENSIKHAIAPRPSGGRVRVDASAVDDHVVLAVWDDGPGFTAEAIRPGHGLENLQGRLAGRFGAAARLVIGRRDGGTLVTVSLPRAGSNGR
jgi:two-component system, LytTR family, sensor histidine kinase AlgZ